MNKILFFPSGDRELPSSHLRVYEVAEELRKLGHTVAIVDPKLSDKDKRLFLKLADPGTIVYIQKIAQKFHSAKNFAHYDQKHMLVYDVDDWHEGLDEPMIKMAHTVVAGSHFVAEYAEKYNKNVHIACSITDTDVYKYVDRSYKTAEDPVQIIWTESFANAYLEDLSMIAGIMRRMHEKYNIRFVLQGLRENRHMANPKYHNLLTKFIRLFPYCIIQKFMPIDEYLTRGVQMMSDSDIGVISFKPERMGKAGQNMRSLMSTGLGVIGTPGNEHEYIIEHGKTGFLATTEEEWERALEILITNRRLRLQMGERAAKSIRAQYSRAQYMRKIQSILNL